MATNTTKNDDASVLSTHTPLIVSYAFNNLKVYDNSSKWEASCKFCKATLKDSKGTTSGFTR